MATITAEQVKDLRERTGAGFMECKRALEAANGDVETAIENMRKAGTAKAAKKADRTAAEGVIVIKISADQKNAVMIEINCETDFVARDQNFTQFANQVAEQALQARISDVNALANLPYQNSQNTIEQVRQELVAKLGENVQIRRLVFIHSDGTIGFYKHGEKIGALVQLANNDAQLGKDLAMHIVASHPQALHPEDVSAEAVAKEKEIFSAQAQASGKPAAIIEKMIDGRIQKFLNEVSLLGQPFVKDPAQTVGDLVKKANTKVIGFVRYQVGEGIEKNTTNFAEEVMAQVRK